MIYSIDFETPKDTLEADARPTVLKVTKGLVYRVEIQFPRGCAGLLGCAVFDGSHQVWPSNLGQWFRGNANTIQFDDTYLKLTEPFQFDIFTYNLDDTYAHTVLVRVGMVSDDVFMARFLPSYSWEYFKEMMEEMVKAQEELIELRLREPYE